MSAYALSLSLALMAVLAFLVFAPKPLEVPLASVSDLVVHP